VLQGSQSTVSAARRWSMQSANTVMACSKFRTKGVRVCTSWHGFERELTIDLPQKSHPPLASIRCLF